MQHPTPAALVQTLSALASHCLGIRWLQLKGSGPDPHGHMAAKLPLVGQGHAEPVTLVLSVTHLGRLSIIPRNLDPSLKHFRPHASFPWLGQPD